MNEEGATQRQASDVTLPFTAVCPGHSMNEEGATQRQAPDNTLSSQTFGNLLLGCCVTLCEGRVMFC